MSKEKNIRGVKALVAGIVLVLSSIITLIVIQTNKNKGSEEEEPIVDLDIAIDNVENSGAEAPSNMGFTVEQIKIIQTYLLQIGIKHNNQYIIDAIQLTGGIDGKIGSGFHAAIQEAKDKGYLKGYEDILKRLGY
jgi:hypothetical protein